MRLGEIAIDLNATIAHSSQVTYTGEDVADVAVAWLATTLNLRVPRVVKDTSLVSEVVFAPRFVQALPLNREFFSSILTDHLLHLLQ